MMTYEEVQGEVKRLRDKMRSTEKKKTKGVAIRSRVQWKHVGL